MSNALKQLYKNFGVTPTKDVAEKEFVNRCNKFLQEFLQRTSGEGAKRYFMAVCFQLGFNGQDIINDYNKRSHSIVEYIPDITKVFNEGFFTTLQIVVATRKYFSDLSNKSLVAYFDSQIQEIVNLSVVDLGIAYQEGMFFPRGEEILDRELIGNSLSVLSEYPNEEIDFKKALENHSSGSKYGVIENCYRCIEGLLRQILRNNKTLIDNKAEAIKSVGLTDHWKKILAQYIEYGNEYGRHASEKRHKFNDAEVEAYLYTTCILIRLIIRLK